MARFMRKGLTRFYWVPSIASASLVPTAAEVNAGTRLDTQLAEINGFSFANQPIDTPDMSTTFTAKVAGEDQSEDSSLMFYEDVSSNPIRTALAKGNNGFVVIFFAGIAGATPAAADKADVWPAQIGSNTRAYTADNEAAKYNVSIIPTAVPGFDKTLT
jgi:hypothetical protein